MNYEIINSGSDGNAILLENSILLDCGVTYKKIEPYLKKVKVIFLTHIHQDHFKKSTIKKIAYEYPNIKFLVGYYLVSHLIECGVSPKNIFQLVFDEWYDIGIAKVRIEEVQHDVLNACLKMEMKDKKMVYIVDTNNVDYISAKNYDLYLIEGNYIADESLNVEVREQEEKGEFSYLKRVLKTHLSQTQAIEWLKKNMGDNGEFEFIHQHKDKKEKEIENENTK